MNQVLEAIQTRRSIRKFQSRPVEKEKLHEITEAGLYAASGKGKQAAKMLVIQDPALREKFRAANCKIGGWKPDFDPFYGAPVIIVVIAENWYNGTADGSLVMGNLMLAAHSLGLGSIWINRAREEFETDEFKDFLKEQGIEGEWIGVGHCAIGYIDGEVPPCAKRKDDRVIWL